MGKATEIANSAGGHCVDRGISVMRLALGYDKGLPDRWPYEIGKTPRILAQLSALAFPDRKVRVWHNTSAWNRHAPNVCYEGDFLTDQNLDEWLTAFSYFSSDRKRSHFVIGDPVTYGAIVLDFVLAVSRETL